MRFIHFLPLALLLCPDSYAQEAGQGAPPGIDQRFISAFFRNRFNSYVSIPAVANVRSFGTTGYLQEFYDAQGNKNNKFALIKSNGSLSLANDADDVKQVYPALYTNYTGIGVGNAGFPTIDTGTCPATTTGTATVCTYQIFSKNYALFSFPSSFLTNDSTTDYSVKDVLYIRWAALGGITGVGPAASAESVITSKTGIAATNQLFTRGSLYSITSGASTGKVFAVVGKIFDLYNTVGLHGGSLGIPLSDELNAGNGRFRQNFEGGSVEYTATTDAVIRPAVGAVSLSISSNGVTRMNVGDSLPISATVFATIGGELTDRDVTWITSNGRVVNVIPNGRTATLKALSGGTALIQAASEGKSSSALTIFVAAPCCQIGEGAPTPAIQQAFQDAATRLRLNVALPAANPVRRAGLGYVQDLVSADNPTVRYLLARSDRSPGVYLVAGDLLTAYELEGGATGRLAYPTSDSNSNGRQMFEGGALAGHPVQVVQEPLLTRWASSNYETGSLGAPASAALTYLSFTGATGVGQSFAQGFLFRIQTGQFSSQRILLVQGAILAKYASLAGPNSNSGFPINDEYKVPEGTQQDFEGATLRFNGTDVEIIERDRKPDVNVSPSAITAGGRVRVIVGGFSSGSRLRISFAGTGSPAAFEVQTLQGSYTWEYPIPSNAATSSITITAQDAAETTTRASASFSITALTQANVTLTKKAGDTQTGLPGAQLRNILTVSVKDDQSNALVGIPVTFAASPGSRILSSDAITDENGEANAKVRLQDSEGVVLVTASAASKVTTFSARAAGSSLTNFPKQVRGAAIGSARENLLAASSSILRYHQSRNELPSSLGLSDPALLGDFLRKFCVLDSNGGQLCDGLLSFDSSLEQLPNLWRMKDFAGNSVDVEVNPTTDVAIRDLLAQGSPVLIALSMSNAGGPLQTHFVVAIGVAGDGGIVIADPEPQWNRQRLEDYTTGFQQSGVSLKGILLNVIRFAVRTASPTGFLVNSFRAPIAVRSSNGDCGVAISWPLTDGRGGKPAGDAGIYYCSGLERDYVMSLIADGPFKASVTDLGNPGRHSDINTSGAQSYSLSRPSAQWELGPLGISVRPQDILNAATFTSEIGIGSLLSISGTGLARDGGDTVVTIGDIAAKVQQATEFQLNVEVPKDLPPGDYTMNISSPIGSLDVPLHLAEVAPAIFVNQQTKRAILVNSAGNQMNTPFNPVNRGAVLTIYATGLGAVTQRGNNQVTQQPVTIVLQGQELPASFAGPAPDLPGTYLVNVMIPGTLAPGLDLPLVLHQGGLESNVVNVSVR